MSKTTKTTLSTSNNGSTTTSKRIDNTARTKVQPTSVVNKKPTTLSKTVSKSTEEKKTATRTSTVQSVVKPKATIAKSQPIKATAKSLPLSKDIQKQKGLPIRAKHNIALANQSKNQPQTVHKSNVMNTIHNVTVSSPPPTKREVQVVPESLNVRERTMTRTLQPEEIVILKQPTSKESRNLNVPKPETRTESPKQCYPDNHKILGKESVAFEVLFDENPNERLGKVKGSSNQTFGPKSHFSSQLARSVELNLNQASIEANSHRTEQTASTADSSEDESDQPDYEDDFESYESDFETGSSSSSVSSQSAQESEESSPELSEPDESSEASEETQLPITVIHKEDERKLDSGSYDMNSRKKFLHHHQHQVDSIDTITANSEQLDSGISYSAPNSSLHRTLVEPATSSYETKMSKRGHDLMSKIQLDEVTVVLFDLKPIQYEYYMKLYGNYNCNQMSTQTNDDRLESLAQTDDINIRSMWTQHPPQYDLKFLREHDIYHFNNACGEFESEIETNEESSDVLSKTFTSLNRLRSARLKTTLKSSHTDFDKLNDFLHRADFTLSALLNKPIVRKNLHTTNIPITLGYYNLNSKFLSATRVTKIFSNPKSNLLVIVHDDVEGVYSGDFRNLLSVWNINEPKNPFKLLSTWSKINRTEICAEMQDIIVAGLEDGSVALWDLKEANNLGVQFGDGSCYFPPSQTITPCLGNDELLFTDVGIIIDIKTFRHGQQLSKLQAYRPVQFASLNDSGLITIWTLVNLEDNKWTMLRPSKIDHSKMEYNSPSARFKLTQSAIYNLRDFLNRKPTRPTSSFDKTRSYFESELFSDNALKELQEVNNKPEPDFNGLRFTGFEVGIERLYVSTNRDFILTCTKTLKKEKFRKIAFESSKGLFATALKLLWNEEYLIVGFSNGSVVAYNCNQQKPHTTQPDMIENEPECSKPYANSSSVDIEIGKSCAIQNLVRNERVGSQDRPDSCISTRPSTALDPGWRTATNQLFDKQVLLSGTVLRKDLVNTMELTNDQSKLLALMDGSLRIYDFTTNDEVSCGSYENISDIGLTKETFGRQNLILLTKDEKVQVHILK